MFVIYSFVAEVLFLAVAVHSQPSDDNYVVFNGTVQTAELYPDGVRKNVLTYNGLFPGSVVELTKGDKLLVVLNNLLQSGEPTTVHWHGIYQNHTQLEDGPSMIAQCPLPYGQTQTYNFTLEQSGTHWYHSHYLGQYVDGLFGAIVVQDGYKGYHEKTSYGYQFDAVVIISDHYHADYKTNQRKYMNTAFPPMPQSALINGHGVYPCKPELPFAPISLGATYEGANCRKDLYVRSVYYVRPKKTYRFRVINASALSPFTFSIDYHKLWTMEVDGVLVDKAKVTEATHALIAPGQTYSFLVDMDQPMGKYSIRAVMKNEVVGLFDGTPIQVPVSAEELVSKTATAALIYEEKPRLFSNLHLLPRVTEKITFLQHYTNFFGPVFSKQIYVDEMSLLPADGLEAPENVDVEIPLNLKLSLSEEGHILSLVNGKRFVPPTNIPLIWLYMLGQEIPEEHNPYEIEFLQSVQLIINNKEPFPHPMHLHGHDFWILGKGKPFKGDYDPDIHFDQLKTATVKRNVVMIPPKTWVVLRFVANNDGVWPFHCHIDWHYLGGMAVVFVTGQKHFLDTTGETDTITEESKILCILNGLP